MLNLIGVDCINSILDLPRRHPLASGSRVAARYPPQWLCNGARQDVNSDRDLDSPVNNTEPAAVGILPVGGDFGEQGLESNVVLVLVQVVLQSVLPASQSRHILLGRVLEFSGKSDGITEPSGDGGLDLGDSTSETTITANEDVLRVGLVEFIIGGVEEVTCLLVRPRTLSLGSPLLVFIP